MVWSITLPLALAQTIFWASTFYLLPALLRVIESDTGWSKGEIAFALTCSLIISALFSPFTGKTIDAGHGQLMMTGAGIGSALLLLLFSYTTIVPLMIAVWLFIGICMAASLYEPCFSIVTRHLGADAKRTITHITLIAGFASTVSFPVANWIAHEADWRNAVRFFAALTFFAGVPLAWTSIGRLDRLKPVVRDLHAQAIKPTRQARQVFWLLGIAFTFGGINQGMIVTHLLPLLGERGLATDTAVLAAMVIGPMQVVGRLILMTGPSNLSNVTTGFICFGGTGLAAFLLYLAGASVPLIFLAVALQGGGWGIVSIVRPALTRDMLGQTGFGSISGRMAALFTLGVALAPTLGAVLWEAGGYDLMLGTGFTLAAMGAAFLWCAVRISKHPSLIEG